MSPASSIGRPPRGLNSDDCIERILHSSDGNKALSHLDLYKTVLEEFDMADVKIRGRFQSIMGMILAAFELFSVISLNAMRGQALSDAFESNNNDVSVILMLLSNITSSNSLLPVAPLHTSFRDFLTDSNRSGQFYVALSDATAIWLTQLYEQAMLRFNMRELETSYRLNSDVPDLSERMQKEIPFALSYSCRFWANHLAPVPKFDVDLFHSVRSFRLGWKCSVC